MDNMVLSVTDFVALCNQTLEFAYPNVTIEGELANFRVSKNKWVYFDVKDDYSSLKCFGTVYMLPGPLEDGMLINVSGRPRLHPQYGFSLNIISVRPVGEGSIKQAARLLEAKLAKEGLFDPARKRHLPYPPKSIGLIASGESAAYHDFIKVLNARFGGIDLYHVDVQVQGESAPEQIANAINFLNTHSSAPESLVIIRGGGSTQDLAAFSTEQVVRAIAGSRVPTIVGIGHEVDISLAELAADKRASTPSNAAELLVPDKTAEKKQLADKNSRLRRASLTVIDNLSSSLLENKLVLNKRINDVVQKSLDSLGNKRLLLLALNPLSPLKKGYSLIYRNNKLIRSAKRLKPNDRLLIRMSDGEVDATVDQ